MCGRFTLDPTTKFYERFKVANRLDLTARYNIAPSQDVPVIIRNSPNRIEMMRWGLIPHWAKDESIGYKMINARAETITEKPAYRSLLRS
jgi:putative SOS response-associated peptidase YedK